MLTWHTAGRPGGKVLGVPPDPTAVDSDTVPPGHLAVPFRLLSDAAAHPAPHSSSPRLRSELLPSRLSLLPTQIPLKSLSNPSKSEGIARGIGPSPSSEVYPLRSLAFCWLDLCYFVALFSLIVTLDVLICPKSII